MEHSELQRNQKQPFLEQNDNQSQCAFIQARKFGLVVIYNVDMLSKNNKG